jgi:hypothetical protein
VWALAFFRIASHSSSFDAALLQFLTPEILMSCHTHFFHLNPGLNTFLVPSGLVLNTLLIILFSPARVRCPAHSSLSTFMNLIISGSLNSLYSSGYISSSMFHFLPLVQKYSYISRSSFQRYLKSLSSDLDISQVLEACDSTGLTSTLYIIILVFLRIN